MLRTALDVSMVKLFRPFCDFELSSVPVWSKFLVLVGGLTLVVVGWMTYTHRALGQCHRREREIAEFRFGISLKQIMDLPIREQDRERFGGMCRLYQVKRYHHLDANPRRPI